MNFDICVDNWVLLQHGRGGCSVCSGLCWEVEGFWFKTRCGQNIHCPYRLQLPPHDPQRDKSDKKMKQSSIFGCIEGEMKKKGIFKLILKKTTWVKLYIFALALNLKFPGVFQYATTIRNALIINWTYSSVLSNNYLPESCQINKPLLDRLQWTMVP